MKRSARKFAIAALAAWTLLIFFGFLAQRSRPVPASNQRDVLGLEQQLLLLEQEVASLKARLALPSVLEDRSIGGFQPLPARMTPVPDLSPSRRSAILDIGSADGVEPGLGVISREMLIGRVAEVSRHHSRVMLADDPRFRVRFAHLHGDAVAGGYSEEGIASGGPRDGVLHCEFQRDPMQVKNGDLIVSAGGEGVFPRGIVIGETERTEGSDFRIRMHLDPLGVKEVLVLAHENTLEESDERAGG